MSEKRQRSPSPIQKSTHNAKKHKEELSPPKSIKVLLRELGFLQKWEKITETNKSSRFYYNRRTGKSMHTTPYQDIKSERYLTSISQFLEKHGPDRTIDYLIELLESYIFHLYENKKEIYIRDILRFDVLGFGHGGEKSARPNSINPKYMPDSITFCMPSNIIGTSSHLNPSIDYMHTQYTKNKNLSRSEKAELRDTISQRYQKRGYKCNYDISEIQNATQKMVELSEEKDHTPYELNRIMKSTIPRLIEEWCSNEWDEYIIFKYRVERNTQAFREKKITEKDVAEAFQAAIEILREKEQSIIQEKAMCIEGAQRSVTDSLKSHNLVTVNDKKKMISQIQLLSSDSGLYPNVLSNFVILFSVQSGDPQFDLFMNDGFASLRSHFIEKYDMGTGKYSYDIDSLYENQRGLEPNKHGLPYKMFQKLSVVFGIIPPDYQYISDSKRVLDPTKLFNMLSYYGSIPRYTSTSCRSGHDIKDVPFYDSEGGSKKKTRKRRSRGSRVRQTRIV
jgi:hypothetical protein